MDLKQRLKKLECHFTWDLEYSTNELQELLSNLNDVDRETCTWLVHYYNLLAYIHQALGSSTEALMNLDKAESVIQEQGREEAGVRLQVNKANLAWVYFHLGKLEKSKEYLEEVERLQRMHPAPPGCTLHPEVSGEKGWTLVKFDLSKRHQAIDYFKMALEAQPDRKEWHKGLAMVMNMECVQSKFTPEQIVEQLKIAHEKDPSSLLLHAQYLLKLCDQKPSEHKKTVSSEDIEREMRDLLERTLETGNLEGLHIILRYYRKEISFDKAIQIAETVQEKFPSSVKASKPLANCYKWKVYNMEDSEEKEIFAKKAIKLFEKVVRRNPHSYKVKISLASMHRYAHNRKRADEIYQQLLSEINDLSPDRQQHIYYNYAYHLFICRQYEESIKYHMKVAKIPSDTVDKQKSIKILQKIVGKGRSHQCEEILLILERINISD
ncbi:interferon-induced protein with tetratricopeptide repeats 1-like isoform X2 [Ctenopharyngodon idella]|uniref:interferon-induced protein with tetratricopeptide repeats 1-like isoform X1 n=1 Tax=Ctenopharyngodon idella TaxID=7959 RepID=UPI00222EAA03|nr:interferon-induced protein with tetratricopeptide repeats 1-like isoform X1 [Ctenopharyngodon idella]XP_051725310.1 interferon-induced protein with tetratricopeptide repeats 1-like isoform X2 [Ctenopharyngodon idella]